MDIASATAIRLTDACPVRMPQDGLTTPGQQNKEACPLSSGRLSDIEHNCCKERKRHARLRNAAMHSRWSASKLGMLHRRWDDALDCAACRPEMAGDAELTGKTQGIYPSGKRSLAAGLASDGEDASRLLQHSSKARTERNYRTKAEVLTAMH